ncbi:MAG TPA: aldolase/citrate lyase family protein [Stellaceae bacterium]|nr:aldolase/citrate lyase family protein [Stellaceae bacterium]
MAQRINRAIELLAQDQAIYYLGNHTGHVLTREQGREDAHTWADYINVGMEHGAFDMTGLAAYLAGLVDAGPTRSGHRSPTVIVEAPLNGIDEDHVRYNAWQFRQILGRGAHGILLCQVETAGAARAFVESCRYPHHLEGVDPDLPAPLRRMHGAAGKPALGTLGSGTRGRGSELTAAAVWGVSPAEYMRLCEPWPLNPEGELLLGVKLESPEGIAHADEILAVPGLGFAELGPGDLSLALGYTEMPRDNYPPEMQEARAKVMAACRKNGVAFLEIGTPANIVGKIDEGVRVFAGHSEEAARIGRAHQRRMMPV